MDQSPIPQGYGSLPIQTRTGNPYLDEIDQAAGNAHASLSPGAQLALRKAGAPVPISDPQMQGIQGPRPAAPSLPMPQESTQPMASSVTPIQAPQARPAVQPVPVSAQEQAQTGELNRITAPNTGEHNRANTGTSGINQIHNPWGRVPLQILEALGTGFAPGLTSAIPGTQLHHNMLVNQAEGGIAEQEKIREGQEKAQKEASEEELQGGQAAHAYAQAGELTEASKKNTMDIGPGHGVWNIREGKWDVEPTSIDGKNVSEVRPEIGEAMGLVPNKDGRYLVPNAVLTEMVKPKTATGPKNAAELWIQQHPNGKAEELAAFLDKSGVKTDIRQIERGGKPHQVMFNSATGDEIRDLGESGEKPPVVNVNAEQKPGKTLLDRAENTYRTAQQSANDLRNFISMAQSGNKVTAQALPLEGTLAIVTSQGVKRINRTEVEYNQAAGSLFDRIMGEVGKLGAGQPVPDNILRDWKSLADVMEKSSYGTYKAAHDSAVKRYHLTDEEPLPGPGGQTQGGGGVSQPKNKAEYDALPRGTHYMKNGQELVKQ